MTTRQGTPRVLHIQGDFAGHRPQAQRCVRLLNAFGGRLVHAIVSASGDFSAADGLEKGVKIQRRVDFPALKGWPLPGRLQGIARAMQDYDLVLTYGRGGIDAALAHTMFSKVHPLPPLIHHEDGSDETDRQRRGLRSKWYRRLGLGKAAGLVVPTEAMEHAALIDWQQPLGRVKAIRDGVDLKRFARAAKPDAIPRLRKRPGEHWLGCLAMPDSESEVAALVEAIQRLAPEWHLVILDAASDSGGLAAEIAARGLDHLVHVAPKGTDRAIALALTDIVLLPRTIEPLPLAAIEAMAAARPVVTLGSGEAVRALSGDDAGLLAAETPVAVIERLAGDHYLRQSVGAANRARAEAERDEAAMIAAYRRLYSSAIGRDAI